MPEDPRQLCGPELLIAGRDPSFLRLAAATLGRAGYAVRTTADRLGRVERLTALHTPDVLVLDAEHERVIQIRARIPSSLQPIAIVLIADDPVHARSDGADAVIARWGPPAHLLEAVRRALAKAAERQGGSAVPPRLRLVNP